MSIQPLSSVNGYTKHSDCICVAIHWWRWLYSCRNVWIIVKRGLVSTKGSWLIYLATQDATKVFSLTVHTHTHTGESQCEWKKIRTLHAVMEACLSATESTQVKYCTQKCKSIHCVIYTDVQFPLCLLSLHSSCMQRQQRQQRDSMTKNCQVCRAPTHTQHQQNY